jgi:hypothetical protein
MSSRQSTSASDWTPAGRVFLWAAIGHQDQPPDRIEVVVCEHCAVVVPVEHADRHIRWHRWNEGVVELPVTSHPL